MIGYVPGSGWPAMEGVVTVKRRHVYEGGNGAEHIQELYDQGVRKVILTAAVGGVYYPDGIVSFIKDTITLFCPSPLEGPKFVSLANAFTTPGYGLTHAFVPGPHYETRSDVKALSSLGANVVGMSITPEVIMARYLSMEVCALVLITNEAGEDCTHADVLKMAQSYQTLMKYKVKEAMELLK